jgi:hypothetical protein
MTARSRPTRRILLSGSAAALAAGALADTIPAIAYQVDRDLLDLLLTQEQIQVAHYTAMLAAFDAAAFRAAGLPETTRSAIESILAAEETHLSALERPEGESSPAPVAPPPAGVIEAMQEAAELENLAVASYAFVIPELDRQRLLPELIGIHSVEARHATWLATLLGTDPFPNAIDPALTLEESVTDPRTTPAVPPAVGTPAVDQEVAPLVSAIARDLEVPENTVAVLMVEPRDWPDSSLGCPQPDMLYAQVLTPGYLIMVEVSGEEIEYHADERGNVIRCP